MKIHSAMTPQGRPPRIVLQTLRKKYEYDADNYYGQVFLIPKERKPGADSYVVEHGFRLVEDPYNADWYYLEAIGGEVLQKLCDT